MFAQAFRESRDFRDVLQAGKDVDATLGSRGWAVIAGLLGDRKDKLTRELVDSKTLSERDYVAKAAEVRGLEMALQVGGTVLYEAERAVLEQESRGEVDTGG